MSSISTKLVRLAAVLLGCAGSLNSAQITPNLTNKAPTLVTGEIRGLAIGRAVPARLYIRNERGDFFFAESAAANGSAVRYDRQNGANKRAIERHTALSAHPFRVALPPGSYTFSVERGKEFHPLERTVEVGETPIKLRLDLTRFVDMAKRGWYSGDTHVHRDPSELATVTPAEDLNVVHPMTGWTTESDVPPDRSGRSLKGDFPPGPIVVDPTHVIYPRNTEYEIFQTGKANHTLGALVILNHQTRFANPILPLSRTRRIRTRVIR